MVITHSPVDRVSFGLTRPRHARPLASARRIVGCNPETVMVSVNKQTPGNGPSSVSSIVASVSVNQLGAIIGALRNAVEFPGEVVPSQTSILVQCTYTPLSAGGYQLACTALPRMAQTDGRKEVAVMPNDLTGQRPSSNAYPPPARNHRVLPVVMAVAVKAYNG